MGRILPFLAIAGCLVAVAVVEQRLPYDPSVARILYYLQPLLVIALLTALAIAVGAWIQKAEEPSASAVLLAGLFLLIDPYSAGYSGGHWGFQVEYSWQIAASGFLMLMLLATLVQLKRKKFQAASILSGTEFAAFALVNIIYIVRDGFYIRSVAGEYSSPLPLLLLLGGIVCRVFIQFRLVTVTRATFQ